MTFAQELSSSEPTLDISQEKLQLRHSQVRNLLLNSQSHNYFYLEKAIQPR